MEATMAQTATVKVGDKAPDFELVNQDRQPVRLSSFRGRSHVVLAFHPLAFTPNCSLQMQSYEQHREDLEALEAKVFGQMDAWNARVHGEPACRRRAATSSAVTCPVVRTSPCSMRQRTCCVRSPPMPRFSVWRGA